MKRFKVVYEMKGNIYVKYVFAKTMLDALLKFKWKDLTIIEIVKAGNANLWREEN